MLEMVFRKIVKNKIWSQNRKIYLFCVHCCFLMEEGKADLFSVWGPLFSDMMASGLPGDGVVDHFWGFPSTSVPFA